MIHFGCLIQLLIRVIKYTFNESIYGLIENDVNKRKCLKLALINDENNTEMINKQLYNIMYVSII